MKPTQLTSVLNQPLITPCFCFSKWAKRHHRGCPVPQHFRNLFEEQHEKKSKGNPLIFPSSVGGFMKASLYPNSAPHISNSDWTFFTVRHSPITWLGPSTGQLNFSWNTNNGLAGARMARLCEFSRICGVGGEHNAGKAFSFRSERKRPVNGSRDWPHAPTPAGQPSVVLWWLFRQHLCKLQLGALSLSF